MAGKHDDRGLVELSAYPLPTRAKNAFWETALGISTRGVIDTDHADSYHYATMAYATIGRVLDQLALKPDDVFVDIGCGKGRVVCAAGRRSIRRATGIERSEELATQARRNAASVRGRRAPIEVHQADAVDFDYGDGTVFFLYNPFGAATMETVLDRIGRQTSGRSIRIAYVNPIHDDVFARKSWLRPDGHWDHDAQRIEHSVSFYRS